jgi:hypothetical protein
MPTPAISTLTELPSKLITVTFGGRFFKCSQNTYAALLETQARLSKVKPGAYIRVIQGCYNTTVAASAGTHDYDACLDVQIVGMTWQEAQDFLRKCGWAAWWRHTGAWASPSSWHVHMALLGAPQAGCKVGEYVDGGVSLYGSARASSQYADYQAHRDGLADHSIDPTWHPANIAGTMFKYAIWLEDNMPLSDKDIARIADAVTPKVVSALLNASVGPADDATPVRTALYRASNVPDLIRAKTDAAVKSVVKKLQNPNA